MSEMVVEYARRPITVAELERMAEAGIIGPEERVELIEGELIAMPPIGDAHGSGTARLTLLLTERFNRRAIVWIQGPIVASDVSQTVPDLTLVRWDPVFLVSRKPRSSDVLLIVEVADSTLGYDRVKKRRLYARAGVPEYWILNLVDGVIEIFRKPHDGEYQVTFQAQSGGTLAPEAFPADAFSVDELVDGPRA